MSQDLSLEDGTSTQGSAGVEIRKTKWWRELRESSLDYHNKMYGKLTMNFKGGFNSVLLVVIMYSMILEILFLYTPVVDNGKKCFKLENKLAVSVLILRSYLDFGYLYYSWWMPINSQQKGRRTKIFFFLVDLITILPLPQVAVGSSVRRGKKFFIAMKFFLLQHALRVIRVYTWFQKAKITGNLAEWAIHAFNLSYFHSSHVIGAIWYFFAVERQTVCWRKACTNHTGCDQLSFYCNESSGNYTFSSDFCSTTYDFGLFRDAIQSGVVGQNFRQRFFPSFRWGLQSVSSFAQGLPFSANVWENIFVISIAIYSVVLFLFLIGKVQMHIQSETEQSEERRQKLREIERWLPFRKLHEELQKQVKEQKWRQTRCVNVQYLLNNLPEDLGKDIKRQLCFDLLKKVEEFDNRGDAFLEDLCDHLKWVLYAEHSYVVQERGTIDKMLFVLQGKLRSYSSRSITAGSSSTAHNKNNHLEDGDFCGEELVDWVVQANPDSSYLPSSTTTIQALTDVEAFVLTADDLKKCITDHNEKQGSPGRNAQTSA